MATDHDDGLDDIMDPDRVFRCWCGATGTYEELFDESDCEEGCGGTGYRHCFCGGDLCVCHLHGGMECDGCEDCDFGEDDEEGRDYEPMGYL